MEISDPDVRVREMCAVQASSGRKGIWRLAVWLDVMVLPSASVTTIMKMLCDLGTGFCVKSEKVVKLSFCALTG